MLSFRGPCTRAGVFPTLRRGSLMAATISLRRSPCVRRPPPHAGAPARRRGDQGARPGSEVPCREISAHHSWMLRVDVPAADVDDRPSSLTHCDRSPFSRQLHSARAHSCHAPVVCSSRTWILCCPGTRSGTVFTVHAGVTPLARCDPNDPFSLAYTWLPGRMKQGEDCQDHRHQPRSRDNPRRRLPRSMAAARNSRKGRAESDHTSRTSSAPAPDAAWL